MSNIIITVESGSDMPIKLAEKYGIFVIPMYVQFGDTSKADGTFPPSYVCQYYKMTGKAPKTSGSMPEDYRKVFDKIHQRWPEKLILHLAYSAVTTCSYQSAMIASEGKDYIACVDTRQVTVGQTAVAVEVARRLKQKENWDLKEAVSLAEKVIGKVRMCFIPKNLTYLRAGGRCSGLTAFCGNLLHLHPCIEVLQGYLKVGKKYRGSMKNIVPRLIRDFVNREELDRREIWFLHTIDFSDEIRSAASGAAYEEGFHTVRWMQAGGVITTHGGPGAFAMAGYSASIHEKLLQK